MVRNRPIKQNRRGKGRRKLSVRYRTYARGEKGSNRRALEIWTKGTKKRPLCEWACRCDNAGHLAERDRCDKSSMSDAPETSSRLKGGNGQIAYGVSRLRT